MCKKLFVLVCISAHVFSMELMIEHQVNRESPHLQVSQVMNVLYQFTGTTQLKTDYTTRTYLWSQLQQDPSSFSSFIVHGEPTQQLLALFFNHRQQAITKIPDQVVQSFAFNKRSGVACAVGSSVMALAVMFWSLWVCYE